MPHFLSPWSQRLSASIYNGTFWLWLGWESNFCWGNRYLSLQKILKILFIRNRSFCPVHFHFTPKNFEISFFVLASCESCQRIVFGPCTFGNMFLPFKIKKLQGIFFLSWNFVGTSTAPLEIYLILFTTYTHTGEKKKGGLPWCLRLAKNILLWYAWLSYWLGCVVSSASLLISLIMLCNGWFPIVIKW